MQTIIVRGIVGAGKTEARDYLAQKLHAKPLSTDAIRKEIPWLNFESGARFLADNASIADKIRYAYDLMHTAVIGKGTNPNDVIESFVKRTSSYHPIDMTQLDGVEKYLASTLSDERQIAVCEAPFWPLEYLQMFNDLQPVIVEIHASDTLVVDRLRERKDNESIATTQIFRGFRSRGYASAQDFGYHIHSVDNSGSKEQLHTSLDKEINIIRACNACPPRAL